MAEQNQTEGAMELTVQKPDEPEQKPTEPEQKPAEPEQKPTEPEQEQKGTKEVTELDGKIIRQMEYYFGDINLPRDKFLLQEIKDDDEGWVPLQTMTKFHRLCQMSSDIAVLAAAMRKSTSGLMEVSDDGLKIRRKPDRQLPDFNKERRDELKVRSIYAKGFPLTTTLDELQPFFEKAGKTDFIQMRKNKDKEFKGSCFVVYEVENSVKKFMEMDEMAKFGDEELIRMIKDDYFKMKNDEKKKDKQEELKKKQEQREQYLKKQEDERKQTLSDKMTHGAVLHLSKIPDDTTREDLKAVFEDYGKVCWAEFDKGDTEGKLRFDGENGAKDALEKLQAAKDGKVIMKDSELECRVLDGDEELEYWKFVSQQRDRTNRNRRGGRSNQFYGGRGRKRRSAGGDDDEPRSKMSRGDYD
jgi:lupus La protein